MPQTSLPYGKQKITVEIPDDFFQEVLLPNPVKFPEDPIVEIRKALANPIGSGRLGELVSPASRIALLCDDISRPTPTAEILPLIIAELNKAGVPDRQIFIVMALGSHRPMSEEEMVSKVGSDLKRRIAVFNSEFLDRSRMIDLGIAAGGVKVWADRRAMEADLRLGIGSIVPHPAVGWSGGGKIIYPGITGEDTVAAFHLQHGKVPWNMFGAEKSPVRENMEQWVDKVGLHFILNVICTAEGRIYKAVAGDYRQAHREGVVFAKQLFGVKATGKVDIAIVSSHPADNDFWQATKGVLAGDFLVKDGGTLILVTPCPEGVGPHPNYTAYIGDSQIETLLMTDTLTTDKVKEPLALAVAATVARIKKRIQLVLVSDGISFKQATEAGFTKFETLENALNNAFQRYTNPKVTILPYGAETYPIVEEY